MTKDAALTIRDLRFGFVPKRVVVDIARFDLARGERVFLKGASGSGKSTLLGLIAGILQADAGEVSVLGKPASALILKRSGPGAPVSCPWVSSSAWPRRAP